MPPIVALSSNGIGVVVNFIVLTQKALSITEVYREITYE